PSSAMRAVAARSRSPRRDLIADDSRFAIANSISAVLRSLIPTTSGGPSSFNCALRNRASASASLRRSSLVPRERSLRSLSICLRASSASALFSSKRRCSSVVSKPSTGIPCFTSAPSGARNAILNCQTSVSGGGPRACVASDASVPVTSKPVTRSPRVACTHVPRRSAASLLRSVQPPKRNAATSATGIAMRKRPVAPLRGLAVTRRHHPTARPRDCATDFSTTFRLHDRRELAPFFDAANRDAVLPVARSELHALRLSVGEVDDRFAAGEIDSGARRAQHERADALFRARDLAPRLLDAQENVLPVGCDLRPFRAHHVERFVVLRLRAQQRGLVLFELAAGQQVARYRGLQLRF